MSLISHIDVNILAYLLQYIAMCSFFSQNIWKTNKQEEVTNFAEFQVMDQDYFVHVVFQHLCMSIFINTEKMSIYCY